eukprot:7305861-Karenia_brevis.AAC.1
MTTLKDLLQRARELGQFGRKLFSLVWPHKRMARIWTLLVLNHAIHNFDKRIRDRVTFGVQN